MRSTAGRRFEDVEQFPADLMQPGHHPRLGQVPAAGEDELTAALAVDEVQSPQSLCENLQRAGSFKIRGAFSLMTTLPKDCPGVVAHSSGNHAQAVARAAKVLGLHAVIAMPSDAPPLKRQIR